MYLYHRPCFVFMLIVNWINKSICGLYFLAVKLALNLDLIFNEEHIPDDFLQADVRVGERRHLVFATPSQLNLLAKATTWYMDATFKVVKSPFTQLFSIHAFVKQDEDIKQFPLAYALMSGKRRRDYKKVLQAILDWLLQEIAKSHEDS